MSSLPCYGALWDLNPHNDGFTRFNIERRISDAISHYDNKLCIHTCYGPAHKSTTVSIVTSSTVTSISYLNSCKLIQILHSAFG